MTNVLKLLLIKAAFAFLVYQLYDASLYGLGFDRIIKFFRASIPLLPPSDPAPNLLTFQPPSLKLLELGPNIFDFCLQTLACGVDLKSHLCTMHYSLSLLSIAFRMHNSQYHFVTLLSFPKIGIWFESPSHFCLSCSTTLLSLRKAQFILYLPPCGLSSLNVS